MHLKFCLKLYLTHSISSQQMGNVSKTALFVSTISRQHDILMGSLYSVFCESTTAVKFCCLLHLQMWFIQSRTTLSTPMTLHTLWIIQRWNGWPAINLLLPLTLPVVKLSWGWSNLYSKIYFPDMATDIITLGNRMGWPFMILPVSDKYSDKVQIFLKNNFCPPFLSLKPLGMDVCDCSGLFTINVSLEVRTSITPPMRWTNCMDYWSSWVDPTSVC